MVIRSNKYASNLLDYNTSISVLQMQIVRPGSTPPVTKCCSKELPDTNFLPKTMPRLLPAARPRRTVQKENMR